MIIERFISDVSSRTTNIIQNFFNGFNENIYGKPGVDDLMFSNEIKDIVIKYTRNEDIIDYIPYEIESLTNTLINSMYYTTITRQLDTNDMVKFISRAIEEHLNKSILISNELEKEVNFQNGNFW